MEQEIKKCNTCYYAGYEDDGQFIKCAYYWYTRKNFPLKHASILKKKGCFLYKNRCKYCKHNRNLATGKKVCAVHSYNDECSSYEDRIK